MIHLPIFEFRSTILETLKVFYLPRYNTVRGDIIVLRSDTKRLAGTITTGERENADLRVDYERRSKMAELIEEDLENLNRLKTRAVKVQSNGSVVLSSKNSTIERIALS